jgi:septation ring formation regulator EzrA
VALSIDELKNERDSLKAELREIEAEQRRVEGELKGVRQRELQAKRKIEALTTLIEISETIEEKSGNE